MKILLIEDDEHKRQSIESALLDCRTDTTIFSVNSLCTAVECLDCGPFDLIVLDMAIPSHPPVAGEGSPVSLLTGGLDVLLELNSMGRSDPCIIITQYPEIEISHNFYPVFGAKYAILELLDYNVIDCVAYSDEDESWLIKFRKLLESYGNSSS
jgi:CheY-like chemotaxis protein